MFKIYKYVDDDLNDDTLTDEQDVEGMDFEDSDSDFDQDFSLDGDNDEAELDGEASEEEESQEESQEEVDPDFQGIIRTVPGACLVYKRKTENNTFEELWVYNAGGRDLAPEIKIRNSILAGTDIDPKTQRSPEGDQVCETITVGNVQFLKIVGLVN